MKVAVSGAMGRLGSVIAHGISNTNELQLSGAYAPGHAGKTVAGVGVDDVIENPCHVVFRDTKNNDDRIVPISNELYKKLVNLPHNNGLVFISPRGKNKLNSGEIKSRP